MGLGEMLETALVECYQLIVTTTTVVGSGQREADGEDYMMISLRGGWSHIEYDLGGGQMTCSLGQKVNEDLPHTLSIARTSRHVSLSLDGLHQQNESDGLHQPRPSLQLGAVPGVRMSEENSQFTNRTFSALIITRTSISIFWMKTWALLMRTNTLRENRIKTCLV